MFGFFVSLVICGSTDNPGFERFLPIIWANRCRSGRGTFEVFHEYSLKFEGYLPSCAKVPAAKERDPDCEVELRMLNNAYATA